MIKKDSLHRFVFDNAPIRGEIVQLHDSYQEVLTRHPYPLPVKQLLGQTLVASSLLSATLKYQGSLILQVQGDGPVSLLLAQANAQQHVRGLADWQGDVPLDDFSQAVGNGHLAITIDPGPGAERYQGIVALEGDNLSRVIENYFDQSEQLLTFLFLAANEHVAAGLLLQIMPTEAALESHSDEMWKHIIRLAHTLTKEELLSLSPEDILYRLFHQENARLFSPLPVQFVCHCTREKMARAVRTLGREDAIELAKNQAVSVTCEFCRKQHGFDRVDVEQIFTETVSDTIADEKQTLH